jgi:hypothetical protein
MHTTLKFLLLPVAALIAGCSSVAGVVENGLTTVRDNAAETSARLTVEAAIRNAEAIAAAGGSARVTDQAIDASVEQTISGQYWTVDTTPADGARLVYTIDGNTFAYCLTVPTGSDSLAAIDC